MSQRGRKLLNFPSMTPHNLWTLRRNASVQPCIDDSRKKKKRVHMPVQLKVHQSSWQALRDGALYSTVRITIFPHLADHKCRGRCLFAEDLIEWFIHQLHVPRARLKISHPRRLGVFARFSGLSLCKYRLLVLSHSMTL